MKKLLLLGSFLILGLTTTVANSAEIVAEGAWKTIDFDVAGNWQIVKEDDGLYIVLDDRFETKNGPDLHVLLSPKNVDQLTDKNTSQGSLDAGLLITKDDSKVFKTMKGEQRLKLPSSVDLNSYQSIAIHCVRYSHVWAGASLR